MAGVEKLKLFKFIQKTYHDIGIEPPESNQNRSPINPPISAIEHVMVFYTCLTVVLCLILYLILFWQIQNVSDYIENCERFIEKRMHSTVVYKDANEKVDRITELSAYAMSVTAIFIALPLLLYTIVNYYFLDSGTASFFLFFPTWWPFDWKTPGGYFVAWLLQCAGVVGVTINVIQFFNTVFGSTYLCIVIVEDIKMDMAVFNNTVGTQKDDRSSKLMKRFCDIVQNYSDVKQCVKDFNEVFKYSLFAFFSWEMLSISSLLMTIQFQLWADDSKLYEISILSTIVLWVFIFNLVVCEPGQRVTDQYDEFGVEFGRCDWNKLSIEMQRMYLIFLSDTQRPKNIRSYGRIK